MASASSPESHLEALLTHTDWVRTLASELVADPSAADEVVQETWLQVIQRPPRSLTNARGWLASVMRNVARNRARGESARVRREQVAAREEAVAASDEASANAEQQRALIGHVLALDEVYRSALLLRFYEGMSPREIARMQGVPTATVKTRLARGLDKLRSRLDESFGGDRRAWVGSLAPIASGVSGSALGRVRNSGTKVRLGMPTMLVAVLVGGLWVAARWRLGQGDAPARSVATSQLMEAQTGDTSLVAGRAVPGGVGTPQREAIASPDFVAHDSEERTSVQEEKLAPILTIGVGLFDPTSDGPRAIVLDSDGALFTFEYGEHGRCLIFDPSGNQRGQSKDVGYCSEAVRVGTSMFLTQPSGHLVKFDTVSIKKVGDQPVPDDGGHWLCNPLCAANGIIYVSSGEEGRVHLFDLNLQPHGEWAAFANLREMDAAQDRLYALTGEDGQSTVHAFNVDGSDLPTESGDPLTLPGKMSDLCALSQHRVLLVNENGELRQYKVESAESGLVWTLEGQTNLGTEEWFTEPNTIARATYDANAEILYLSFIPPHPRVVAVPYSIEESRRVRAR
jgi:RNA polymerase sigma-70 factor (ECF subfamily)